MLGLPAALLCAFALGALGAPQAERNLTAREKLVARQNSLAARDAKYAAHVDQHPHLAAKRDARLSEREDRLAAARLRQRADCTFTSAADAMKGQSSCATLYLNGIEVPAGETLDLSDLKDGAHVIFEGTTTFGYKAWEGPLIQVRGTDITVDCDDCTIDCDGSRWWDGKGSNGGVTKPKFFYLHGLTNSHVNNLHVLNTPVQAFSINTVKGLTISGVTMDNSDGDSQGGHNTDAFDVGSSSSVTIEDATVYNQDDCVAVNSVKGFTFSGGFCSGGHGLSIGSVGGRSDNTVQDVTFSSSSVVDSDNGARIKTRADETGLVTGVTYEKITLKNIAKYGILIEQNYDGGDLKGEPTTGIAIEDLTMNGVTGSVSGGCNVAIICGKGSCSDWTWQGVKVTGGKTYGKCENVPSVASC